MNCKDSPRKNYRGVLTFILAATLLLLTGYLNDHYDSSLSDSEPATQTVEIESFPDTSIGRTDNKKPIK